MTDWQQTRWWRVIGPDDELWCESSDEQENREAMRPGDTLQRLEQSVQKRWVDVVSVSARDFTEAQRLLREGNTEGLEALASRTAAKRAAVAAARAREETP